MLIDGMIRRKKPTFKDAVRLKPELEGAGEEEAEGTVLVDLTGLGLIMG